MTSIYYPECKNFYAGDASLPHARPRRMEGALHPLAHAPYTPTPTYVHFSVLITPINKHSSLSATLSSSPSLEPSASFHQGTLTQLLRGNDHPIQPKRSYDLAHQNVPSPNFSLLYFNNPSQLQRQHQ